MSIRSVHKSASSLRQDVPFDRPKSTPPVNKVSLAPPVETVDYDSDPGKRLNEETGRQSGDNAVVVNSAECLGSTEVVNISQDFCCLKATIFSWETHLKATRVIPKVSGLDILDNNIFHNLYISETYIFHEL